MTFRNLFTKIFLWFWLANIVVIAALALAVWMYPRVWRPGPLTFDFDHEKAIRRVFSLYEKDRTEFDREAALLDSGMFQTFWLDDQGHVIGDLKVPDSLLKFADENKAMLAKGEAVMTGPPNGHIAVPLSDSAGRKLTALAIIRRQDRPPRNEYFRFPTEPRILIPRLLAMILAAGIGCFALARYLTAPLRKLQAAAAQIASGELSARVDRQLARRRDEIGELGRDFDQMAQHVETLISTQKQLLRDVSHELRSPLARLNVALELASRDAGAAAAPSLSRAVRESERLNDLIGQLLTLARLEGGQVSFETQRVNLRELVQQIVNDANFEASARQRSVRVTACDQCVVVGTPELLHSAIENVVRNAALYTAENTEVEVRLTRTDNSQLANAVLEIRDHGPGVPDERLTDIFRPFHRVSDARDRQTGGVGLGLAISQRAIELHHGQVMAKNAPGGGLIVHIELPCEPSVKV